MTYSTSLEGRSRAQRINACKGITAINGIVVAPGETFSFNQTVGSWTKDRGFMKAPVSYNGTLLPAFGGGVCQTSTTLYNAALRAGMEIVERHHHRFMPGYVGAGLDSAVAFPDIDLRFRNPYSQPVAISASASSGRLLVSLVSAEEFPRVAIEQKINSVSEPIKIVGAQGGRIRRIHGKLGFDVAIYRRNGKNFEIISHDNYPAMNEIVQKS